jgi:uridylate kinase
LKTTVIKISGSTFYWDVVDKKLPPLLKLFRNLASSGERMVLVAGGGETARRYIVIGRNLGIDESTLDDLGLRAARLNAELLVGGLKELAYPTVPESMDRAAEAFSAGKVVVVGGFHPGHSTNAVAALIAERIHANLFVNATDVDGVYTADPTKNPDARRLRQVTTSQLRKMFESQTVRAGTYELLDLLAVNIIERSRIRTVILKCNPSSIEKAIKGEPVGTLVEAQRS